MNLVLNKLVSTLEELSSEDDNGGSAVTDLSVLNLRELDEDLSSGVLNFELLKDSGTVVCDSNITNVINEHLIKTLRAERALDNVGQ